jgi:NarL family two-component system response regulator LiaR
VIRVLLVDDHPIVRQGVRFLMDQQRDMDVVGEAADGTSALELAEGTKPDVILLDLVMPGPDGIETMRELRRRVPDARIVVLTSYHGDDLIYRTIRAGALSYLLKDVEAAELLHAVRAAVRHESVLHPRVAARVLGGVRGDALTEGLTARELDVLTRIARGQSNRAIAAGLGISDQTVKTHVSNVLSKLHLEHRTQAAVYALRHRLVWLEETDEG